MLIPLTVLSFLAAVSARVCDSNQFWSDISTECRNCSICAPPDVVLRPCQDYRDAICGPLSDLKIDWSFMKHGHRKTSNEDADKEMTQTFLENAKEIRMHEMHVKEKEEILRKLAERKGILDDDLDDDIFRSGSKQELWNKLKELGKERDGRLSNELLNYPKPNRIRVDSKITDLPNDKERLLTVHVGDEDAKNLLRVVSVSPDSIEQFDGHLTFDQRNILQKHFGFFPMTTNEEEDLKNEMFDDVEERPIEDFSMTEKFVLDWQTTILVFAVTACLVFFMVALCYSLIYLRNWKPQAYFAHDVEELKAWLKPKKSNLPPSGIYKTTTEVVHKEAAGHCKYLERIISKNAKKKINRVPQNVYLGACPSAEIHPLTVPEDLEVHKALRV